MPTSKLEEQLAEIESLVHKYDLLNERVSSATIGWHLEHILLVLDRSLYALQTSIVADYKPKTSFKKIIILFTGKIPRGVGKAPKVALPMNENISPGHLQQKIGALKKQLFASNNLPENHFFPHPYFGDLKLKTAIRFLEIHTLHHLKIVRDIVAK